MSVEVCHYRLSLRGKPVGSHILATQHRGRTTVLDAKLTLQGQGSLRSATVTQQSKVHRQQFFSFSFQEKSVEGSDTRTFEVLFDIEAGQVVAKRNREEATVPYIQAFEDPLGLLHHVRSLAPEETTLRVPMLGKNVVVERVGETTLETALGERTAYAYALQPGGSYVYVDAQTPNLILMLRQRFDGQLLDAQLVRVDEEAEAPREPSSRRKRRRRRRKRKS